MSIEAMAWAKSQTVGGVAPKAVLMILADYADERGRAWPSQAVIAAQAEITPRCVRDQLAVLEERGFIQREARFRDDGSRTSDIIELKVGRRAEPAHPPEPRSYPPERPSSPPEPVFRGEEPASGDPRNDVPGPPEPRSGLTTFEPPLEPKDSVASAPPSATKGAAKTDPWEADVKFTALWQACTAEMRRRAKSKATVWPEWVKAKARTPADQILLALSRYLQSDPDVDRTGGPGLQRWLRDRVFEQWLAPEQHPNQTEQPDPEADWRRALERYRAKLFWRDDLGPKPGKPGCRAPPELLAELGLPIPETNVLPFPTEGAAA